MCCFSLIDFTDFGRAPTSVPSVLSTSTFLYLLSCVISIFGTSNSLRNPYGDYNSEPHYRSTTSYPHPHPQSPDQFTDFPGVAGYGMPSAATMGGSSGSMAYMLSANDPTNMRTCEVIFS